VGHVRVFKHYLHLPFLLLGLVEFVVFLAAVFVAAWIRFYQDPEQLTLLEPIWPRAVLFASVMLLAIASMGVYQSYPREGQSGVMLRTGVSYCIGSVVLTLIFYLFPSMFLGRGVVFIAALLSFVVIFTLRIFFSRFSAWNLLKRRVLVLGAGQRAEQLWQSLQQQDALSVCELVGFVSLAPEPSELPAHLILSDKVSLLQLVKTYDVDEIVVTPDDRRLCLPMDDLLDCKLSGIDVMNVVDFFERETAKIEIDFLYPSWLVFADGFTLSLWRSTIKRGFDLLVSLLILFLTWPVMLLTMVAIVLEDGPRAAIFYRQRRTGLGGKDFFVYKFRSMRQDAERGGAQWASAQDNRITQVGHFIRQYRIDELPQLLNVLMGDMAFVGPRPERPEFVETLQKNIPYFAERHRVKPGITGWAQVCFPYGASEEDSRTKLKYDLYYVKNHNLIFDLLIMLQTVEVILFGKGAR
jgi:hypothetical protein